MDFTDDNLFTLNEYLKRTLSPDPSVRKSAEKFLESIELNQNYPLLLLHLVDKKDVDMTIRMSAAVAFKNFVKRNWSIEEDSEDRICAQDRETIRKLIVDMMLHSPESLQRQLCEAVSIIGKCAPRNKVFYTTNIHVKFAQLFPGNSKFCLYF